MLPEEASVGATAEVRFVLREHLDLDRALQSVLGVAVVVRSGSIDEV